MKIYHHPKPGEIFMCKFPDDFIHGEMHKTRPVVVISKEISGRPTLVNVVPLSMTPPNPPGPHHVQVSRAYLPEGMRDQPGERWAKCDMIYTVSLDRLALCIHKGPGGVRKSTKGKIPPVVLKDLRLAIASALKIHRKIFPEQPTEEVVVTIQEPEPERVV